MRATKAWTFLERLSTIAVIVTLAVFLWVKYRGSQPPPPPTVPRMPISFVGAASIGNSDAPVGMLVFSDFQCPFCSKFAQETWPLLMKDYVETGRVYVAFRHYPLPIHTRAKILAEAAQCAGQQGKFWGFHEALFADQTKLDDASLEVHALALGIEPSQWHSCREQEATRLQVDADMQVGKDYGVRGTPWFIVGKLQPARDMVATSAISGMRPVEVFKAAFEAAGLK